MERGDYTGAVRRTVTAIEAVVAWALLAKLQETHGSDEAALKRTENDFPGRLRQWRKLAGPRVQQAELDRFEDTRIVRHQIVHEGRRLTHSDRHIAQQLVDNGRWLYNKIEAKPARAALRETDLAIKSIGRVALAPRFPTVIGADGITVGRM
jgi:hypothetical protein